jgi:peptidoglycan/LPS O-acetylase OafA/YrhL
MRLGLSVAVIAFHSLTVSYGGHAERSLWTGPLGPFWFAIASACFALSDFLVAGGLPRNDLPSFLTLRALRIFVALCVEIVLSALILGSFFTTLTLSDNFSSEIFRAHFLNILDDIHHYLSGVFNNLPSPNFVNGQLWTVPFELRCYIVLCLLAGARLYKQPALYMALIIAASGAAFAHGLIFPHLYPCYGRPTGFFLIRSFLFGVGPKNLRDHIPFSPSGCIGAAVLAYAILSHGETIYLALLPIPSDEQVPAYAPVATRRRSAAPSPLYNGNLGAGLGQRFQLANDHHSSRPIAA